jgi:hypothetical protein
VLDAVGGEHTHVHAACGEQRCDRPAVPAVVPAPDDHVDAQSAGTPGDLEHGAREMTGGAGHQRVVRVPGRDGRRVRGTRLRGGEEREVGRAHLDVTRP